MIILSNPQHAAVKLVFFYHFFDIKFLRHFTTSNVALDAGLETDVIYPEIEANFRIREIIYYSLSLSLL